MAERGSSVPMPADRWGVENSHLTGWGDYINKNDTSFIYGALKVHLGSRLTR